MFKRQANDGMNEGMNEWMSDLQHRSSCWPINNANTQRTCPLPSLDLTNYENFSVVSAALSQSMSTFLFDCLLCLANRMIN